MKKKTITALTCIILACSLLAVAVTVSPDLYAAAKSSPVTNLKKLKKVVKKKKKLSKVFKTEEAGTSSIDWLYYKHNARITTKGNKIYFKDRISYKQKKVVIGEYYVTMVMKVGANKRVKAKVTETVYKKKYVDAYSPTVKSAKRWKKLPTKSLSVTPSTYRFSYSLSDESFIYHAQVHTAMRCWDKLLKKNAKLSMKKIGFTKFKPVSVSDMGYYYMK